MRLDEEKLEALRSWGERLRNSGGEESSAVGRAILMLVEEIDRLHIDLWHAQMEPSGEDLVATDETTEDEEEPVTSSLHARLHRVLRRDAGTATEPVEESGTDGRKLDVTTGVDRCVAASEVGRTTSHRRAGVLVESTVEKWKPELCTWRVLNWWRRATPTVNAMRVTVPSLHKLAYRAAKRRLQRDHLTVGTVRRRYSAQVPQNHVLAQHPRGGAHAHRSRKKGPPVNLILSRGPKHR